MELLETLLQGVRSACAAFPDQRRGDVTYSMADIGLSAFSLFFMRYCPGGYWQAASRSAQAEARWVSGWRRCRPRFSLTRGRIVDSRLRWTVPPSTSSRKLT